MTNKNYQKGVKKEYAIMRRMKLQGFDIISRSAGSHSAIDIFGIHKERKLIMLIQAKPKSFSKNKINELVEKYSWLQGKFDVVFGVK